MTSNANYLAQMATESGFMRTIVAGKYMTDKLLAGSLFKLIISSCSSIQKIQVLRTGEVSSTDDLSGRFCRDRFLTSIRSLAERQRMCGLKTANNPVPNLWWIWISCCISGPREPAGILRRAGPDVMGCGHTPRPRLKASSRILCLMFVMRQNKSETFFWGIWAARKQNSVPLF